MSAQELDSKYDRWFAVHADQYGIDPLKDKVIPILQQITTFTPHVVTQSERGSPDLIALRRYGTEKLWWIILAYNGIASYKDIIEGVTLRIPSLNSVIAVITERSVSSNNQLRVVTI